MSNSIRFTVYGEPIPKGSTRAFMSKGRPVITHANAKTKAWQRMVEDEATLHRPAELLDGAISVDVSFFLTKPKTVKRVYPTVPPDIDKLLRGIFDALTGTIITDDARVVLVCASKQYGEARAIIDVCKLTNEGECE